MNIVTRFNPSSNGNLHCGHIMTLLVNEYFAHSVGGKFYVRFDDTSPHILKMNPEHVKRIAKEQIDIINWLGIDVDGWCYQSDLLPLVKTFLKRHLLFQESFPIDNPEPLVPTFTRYYGTTWVAYPYVPEQIIERVVMDHDMGATHVIRGEDFVTEYSLYCFFCERLKFSPPKFIYLPRLSSRRGDISKTVGGNSIIELKGSGWSAQEIKDFLAHSCLVLPPNGWEITNLKREPCLEL